MTAQTMTGSGKKSAARRTALLGAVFAFATLVSTLLDIAAQLNAWRVVSVSGLRPRELGNRVAPGLG